MNSSYENWEPTDKNDSDKRYLAILAETKTVLSNLNPDKIQELSNDEILEIITVCASLTIEGQTDYNFLRSRIDLIKDSMDSDRNVSPEYIVVVIEKIINELNEDFPVFTREYIYDRIFKLNAERLTLGANLIESEPRGVDVMNNKRFAQLDAEIVSLAKQIEELSVN